MGFLGQRLSRSFANNSLFLRNNLAMMFHAAASHPPHEQMIRVRFPPGYKVFRESIAMLFETNVDLCNMQLRV
jgi:hypothetical protein